VYPPGSNRPEHSTTTETQTSRSVPAWLKPPRAFYNHRDTEVTECTRLAQTAQSILQPERHRGHGVYPPGSNRPEHSTTTETQRSQSVPAWLKPPRAFYNQRDTEVTECTRLAQTVQSILQPQRHRGHRVYPPGSNRPEHSTTTETQRSRSVPAWLKPSRAFYNHRDAEVTECTRLAQTASYPSLLASRFSLLASRFSPLASRLSPLASRLSLLASRLLPDVQSRRKRRQDRHRGQSPQHNA
jgi:predicted Rdx family selenoprotein